MHLSPTFTPENVTHDYRLATKCFKENRAIRGDWLQRRKLLREHQRVTAEMIAECDAGIHAADAMEDYLLDVLSELERAKTALNLR